MSCMFLRSLACFPRVQAGWDSTVLAALCDPPWTRPCPRPRSLRPALLVPLPFLRRMSSMPPWGTWTCGRPWRPGAQATTSPVSCPTCQVSCRLTMPLLSPAPARQRYQLAASLGILRMQAAVTDWGTGHAFTALVPDLSGACRLTGRPCQSWRCGTAATSPGEEPRPLTLAPSLALPRRHRPRRRLFDHPL